MNPATPRPWTKSSAPLPLSLDAHLVQTARTTSAASVPLSSFWTLGAMLDPASTVNGLEALPVVASSPDDLGTAARSGPLAVLAERDSDLLTTWSPEPFEPLLLQLAAPSTPAADGIDQWPCVTFLERSGRHDPWGTGGRSHSLRPGRLPEVMGKDRLMVFTDLERYRGAKFTVRVTPMTSTESWMWLGQPDENRHKRFTYAEYPAISPDHLCATFTATGNTHVIQLFVGKDAKAKQHHVISIRMQQGAVDFTRTISVATAGHKFETGKKQLAAKLVSQLDTVLDLFRDEAVYRAIPRAAYRD